MFTVLQPIDFSILYWIQQHIVNDALNLLMPLVTKLGNAGMIWIVIGVAMLPFRKYRTCGISVLVGLLCGLLIGNLFLKPLAARPRPCWLDDSVQLLIAIPRDYSFPSGHTLSSCIASVTIWLYHKRLGTAALILAVLIAFSRLYLFVHFPSDVLVGALLGVIIALAVHRIISSVIVKRQEQKQI